MKKVKGDPNQWWMKGKLYVRTGEKRLPKHGEHYELNGFAYWCLGFYFEQKLTDVYILKPYIPWYKKLWRKRGEGNGD